MRDIFKQDGMIARDGIELRQCGPAMFSDDTLVPPEAFHPLPRSRGVYTSLDLRPKLVETCNAGKIDLQGLVHTTREQMSMGIDETGRYGLSRKINHPCLRTREPEYDFIPAYGDNPSVTHRNRFGYAVCRIHREDHAMAKNQISLLRGELREHVWG